ERLPHHSLFLAANNNVDQAGVTEDMLECPVARNTPAPLADDDRELAFVVNLAIRQRREHDGIVGAAEARIRFEEEALSAGVELRDKARAGFHLADMRVIVCGIGDHLVRPSDGTIQERLRYGKPLGLREPFKDPGLDMIE